MRDIGTAGAAAPLPLAAGHEELDVGPASPGPRLVPEPGAAARAQALLREMHVWLFAGYPADAVVRAAAVAEIALGAMVGVPPHTHRELGPLIDELRRAGRTEALAEASWLHQLRIALEPLAGQVRAERDMDARRAGEIAIRLARNAGLVTAKQVTDCETAAAWQASAPASTTLHKLDRDTHRIALQDQLDPPPRVLVLMVHGEVGQGHEHFAEIMTRQLRSASRSGWREVLVDWPPPSRPLGIRLATLLEQLSLRLGVALAAPNDDPTSSNGQRTWQPALERIIAGIQAVREPMLLRHVVGCLGSGTDGDHALVDAYVRRIWDTVAQRSGPPVVISLDLRRVERSGFPLTSTWRQARRDVATARAIARILDEHHRSHGGICIALPELTSVPAPELADWLHHHAGLDRDAARIEARQLVASTRGGRFDLVVQRLTALHLDRHRNPR